jgi:hypothetical protein
MAGDHHEVQEVRDHERREHQQRELGGLRRDVGGADHQSTDEREGGEGREVGDQQRQRVACAQVIEEHGRDPDRGRGRGAEQRGREHEREERARDALPAIADREQVGGQRQREQHDDEREGLPVARRGRQSSDDHRGHQQCRFPDHQ